MIYGAPPEPRPAPWRRGLIFGAPVAMMRPAAGHVAPAFTPPVDEGHNLRAARRNPGTVSMKNWVLALILAGFALFMYAAIFLKMSG